MAFIDTITVDNFKAQFRRDFSYLPVWLNSATYNAGVRVYYEVNGLFYDCLNNGVTSTPITTADWLLVADSVDNYVLDEDIVNAFAEAKMTFNASLFGDENSQRLGYLYLTAHFLVMDLRRATQGLNSRAEFAVNSRSVGSVSESYSIPDVFINDPVLQYYTNTDYGLKYLAFVRTSLIGNVVSVMGGTRP